jgi:alkanesulfonate monooxygenase SsuD/methylene tetrahydromethanopterin reductase-like flavin-dependent oxidoreductase (luciferase family)
VWIGGRSDAAMRRALCFGRGCVPDLVSPGRLRRRADRVAELATAAGRTEPLTTVAALATPIAGSDVDASVALGLSGLRLSGLATDAVRPFSVLGDDEAVLARPAEYVDAGAEHLILRCLAGHDRTEEDVFACCARILPEARLLGRRRGAAAGER